ncbi:MAG: D-2-hydroxyacid dehydrogenase [Verrucomicrobiae bacterium]|nr:D-2-hydroxyacid dehydrogenase [Verrucomicrobiae bacterium]
MTTHFPSFHQMEKKNPSLVLLDAATLDCGDLDWRSLERLGKLERHPVTSAAETAGRVREVDIVLSNKVVLDDAIMAGASRLRAIVVCATGVNDVDLAAAKRRGIVVMNVAGYGSDSVAQHAMAMILNWATQMHRYAAEPRRWCESPMYTRLDYPVFELAGKSLGLAGAGRIGGKVGTLAEAFGMEVRAWARDGGAAGKGRWPRLALRELLAASDVVSLHCPLTPETRHLINRESLSWMKPGALLVNTGRGDLIDEPALKEALVSGRLGGAALDVLSVEPPLPDHLLLDPAIPNLLITPHSAWTAREARQRLLDEAAANIAAFLKGEDRNRVA